MTINDIKLEAKDDTLFWDVIYEHKYEYLGNKIERGTYIYSNDRKRYLFLTDCVFLATINLTPSKLLELLNECKSDGRVNIIYYNGKFLVDW
jgi:hypothetical protein